MPALDDTLLQKIALLENKQQRRVLQETAPDGGVWVRRGGRRLLSFSGNDYLGLSQHPEVVAAAKEALEAYGAGAGASRLVTGNHPLHSQLEAELCRYKHTQAACIFGSGYLANLGAITALAGKGDLIIADKFIHACMIDAAKLSGATLIRFAHNNAAHCRMLLEASRAEHHNCLILTETVFSMDGDRAPLAQLRELADAFDAWLMTDDAHGLGVIAHENTPMVDIQMGTLSKGAGSYGGYVCGSQALVDYLQTAARSLIYSTALPPSVVAASAAALKLISHDVALCEKPLARARYFTSQLGLPEASSAIVPVILEANEKALEASSCLESQGFLVAAIRSPTVPENTARLRFAFSALHEEEHIAQVASILREKGWA